MRADEIKTVVIIGAGIMGRGIAQNFAQGGLTVRVIDMDENILENCMEQIDYNLSLFQEYDLLTEEPSAVKSRITSFPSKDESKALRDCDLVVEVIPERLDLKKRLFSQLDLLPKNVILGTNTSSFTVSSITEGMSTPERVIGLHYFNPAHIMPLVEIHRGKATSGGVIETVMDLMIKMDKKPVLIRKEISGFVVNRIQAAMARESHYLVSEGVVSPEDLDTAAMASYGFRLACLGPLETADMGGLDTIYRACKHIFGELNNSAEPSSLLAEKVKRGELGVKTGKGWHDYSESSVNELLEERDRKLLQQLVIFNKNVIKKRL